MKGNDAMARKPKKRRMAPTGLVMVCILDDIGGVWCGILYLVVRVDC